MSMDERDLILDIRGLRTIFSTDEGVVNAVAGIDFQVERGTTTCIVGESGSGKSATARSIMQVIDRPGVIDEGEIWFRPHSDSEPVDIAAMSIKGREIRNLRGKQIGLIFQEPMSSLSPVHTIGNQISEVLEIHEGVKPKEVRERVIDELRRVGIPRPEQRIDSYTFQLSGGMRQRAMIAMALIARPQLIIADEPTTALDVTTQAQILDLLNELKQSLGMTLLFITHDLGVVAEIADNVIVMRDGKVVESGPVSEIFHDPQHDYTKQLLDSLPQRWKDNPFSADGGRAAPSEIVITEPDAAGEHLEPGPQDGPILEIKNLTMRFETVAGKLFGRKSKESITAVDD